MQEQTKTKEQIALEAALEEEVKKAFPTETAKMKLAFKHAIFLPLNKNGDTLLHKAVLTNDLEKVKLVVWAGAAVNMKNVKGETPLHFAARTGNIEIAQFLILSGADVYAKAKAPIHKTPLDVAEIQKEHATKESVKLNYSNFTSYFINKGFKEHSVIKDSKINQTVYRDDLSPAQKVANILENYNSGFKNNKTSVLSSFFSFFHSHNNTKLADTIKDNLTDSMSHEQCAKMIKDKITDYKNLSAGKSYNESGTFAILTNKIIADFEALAAVEKRLENRVTLTQ